MSARAKITMSPEEYLAGLRKLEAETNKSASKMENSFKKYGTSINKAGIAMRYVSSEMGAGAVAFGRAFQVLAGGKIAVAVAAIAAALTGLKKIWDKITVSSEEYNLKLQKTVELEQDQLERLRKSQSEEDATMERLAELAKRQDKTNEEKEEAITLAETLAGKYKDLGVDVDSLTGSYETLLNRIKKINEEQKKQKIASLENVLSTGKKRVNVEFGEALKPGLMGSLFGSQWNETKREDWLRSSSLKEKRDLAQKRFEESTTTEDLNKWGALIDLVDKQIEAEKELKSLLKTGFETAKEEAAARKKASEESRKALEAETDALYEQWAARKALAEQRDKDFKATLDHSRKTIQAYDEERAAEHRANQQRRKDQAESLRVSALRALGRGEEAAIQEALYGEAKARGIGVNSLDEGTRAAFTDMAVMQYRLQSSMQKSTSPELYAPRVNSLIARGGSAAPVKMPEVEKLQTKQLDAQNRTNVIAQRILNSIDAWTTY